MPICPKCRGENPELGAKCPRDGYYYIYDDAVDDAAKDEWIGRLAADKYVILSLISEGGMGAVYRAMQLPVQREVAFKVLRAELQDSDQGQDRFAREARAVSKLSHPNIITMHDFGVDSNGHPFMAMEYAPGMSLAQWIMQPGLKLPRIVHVFRQILSALSEAHNQGIVHRDLKPENLIVTRTGADSDYIKLLDFGIARMVHDGATRGLTKEGEVFGTPHYMAPEQAQGKKDIGPPADVYALGIMLFEMINGQCPFDAPTPLSILYMHINDDLPELTPRSGITVPAMLREVVNTATAKDAADRYQNASEMLQAFDQATGNSQGNLIAPAGTSSGLITSTQSMGAKPLAAKATADTLNFEEPPAQRYTDSSNAVPINDPQESRSTTSELAAFEQSGSRKALLAVVVLAIIAGLGSAFVFLGDDSNAVEATEQASSPNESSQNEASQNGAGDEGEADDQVADRAIGDEEPSDDQAGSEPLELAGSDEKDPAEKRPDDRAPTDTNERTSSKRSVSAKNSGTSPDKDTSKTAGVDPKASDTTASSSKSSGSSDSTGEETAPPREKPPAKTKNTASSSGSSTKDRAEDDGPKKFQPRKFEPKSDSDDEPEKFEPRKWR